MLIKRLNLTEHGICLFVGSLEATILYALWDQREPITMAKFYRYLIEEHKTDASYSTIITTLQRLATKKLIERIDRENSTPLWSKFFIDEAHFIEECIIQTLNVLRTNYSDQFEGYIGLEYDK